MNLFYEAEVMAGLRPWAEEELRQLKGVRLGGRQQPGRAEVEIPFSYRGRRGALRELRLVDAVYEGVTLMVPRPKSLLGHENWQAVMGLVNRVWADWRRRSVPVQTFRVSAAGHESAVFTRFKQRLAADTGLVLDEAGGDLLMRVRPAVDGGWTVMVRMTVRPLSVRPWRVENMVGALNGPAAAAMVAMSQPERGDRVLNVMCGSGTLLAERGRWSGAAVLAGCDLSGAALAAAQTNLEAAGVSAVLGRADGMSLPYGRGAFDRLLLDLPWGQLVGTHDENEWLYPAVMEECARVMAPHGRGVVITHEVQLLERTLAWLTDRWRVVDRVRLREGNVQPTIFVLQRR